MGWVKTIQPSPKSPTLLHLKCIWLAFFQSYASSLQLLRAGSSVSACSAGGAPPPSPAPTTALVEVLTSTTTASSSDNSGIIQNLIDVLTGKVATIALDQLSSLLGLNNPVPSPLSDPVGFLTHPLISPIILVAVTLNPPALALAMGGLAGNLVLTHIFTIATETLVSTTVAAA